MKLPPVAEREAFYWDVIQKCLVSRQDRREQYDRLRNYFLFGCSPDSSPAIYNKINSQLDQLTSFLFAADTTRFSIQLGANVDKREEMPKVAPMVARLMDRWEDSNADIIFSNAVTWSLVFDTTLIKLVQRGTETMPFLVSPENFGVLREDVPMLDRQEAFVQVFYTTRDQLRRDLESHPNKEVLIARLSAARKMESELPAGVQRIIMSTLYPLSGTMTGNAPAPLANQDLYRPRTSEELVEMYELWLWDDGAPKTANSAGKPGGYRIVTIADPSVCIYDRLAFDPATKNGMQVFLEGEHPFTQVCPNPAPDFFWGYSEVAKLCQLQDNRELHIQQANEIVNRNVNTVKFAKGTWGAVDEKNLAMSKMNALISSVGDPTSDIKEFRPQMPQDLWALIREDDNMFAEASSITPILGGHGETGVRSKGQTDTLSRLGSSRPKKRALVIEDSLERIATLYCKLDQEHNPENLYIEKPDGGLGNAFLAKTFTQNYMVKVDAHSSSPVFMEDQKNEAKWMFENGIIDGASYIDLVAPQNAQGLKIKWQAMQIAKAKAAEAEAAMRAQGGGGKVTPLRTPAQG